MRNPKHPKDLTLQSSLESKVDKFFGPLETFIHKQSTASAFLFLTTIITLVLANSPWSYLLESLANIEAGIVLSKWSFLLPLKEWVNSGLMALFFLLIGLEIKREILGGRLKHPQQIGLIILAAIGGMVVPAIIYWGLNYDGDGKHGWAIPMATDTAFAIGVLAIFAKRVSLGISVFLMAMAIFDDIGAIIIISLFYGHDLDMIACLGALFSLSALLAANLCGVRHLGFYSVLGFIMWVFVYYSGLHATLAGLLLALTIPAKIHLGQSGFLKQARGILLLFESGQSPGQDLKILGSSAQHELATDMGDAVHAVSTPLQRMEESLISPIGIIVLPLFALFNAGIVLDLPEVIHALSSPVTWGIIAGLAIGKPLGIISFIYAGLFFKKGKLPDSMRSSEIITVGILGGIGFTMSIFISTLSFEHMPALVEYAKTGIIFTSALSVIMASSWIVLTNRYTRHQSL